MSESTDNLSPAETAEADRKAVAEVIEKARIATVTTIEEPGSLVSRPLAVQDHPFDGAIYFLIPDPSGTADQVRADAAVNVAIERDGDYLSVSGTGSISKDASLIDSLWNSHAEAWFEGGREDPSVAVLKVDAHSAELLASDGPKVLNAVKYAKALLTGEQPDIGEQTRVQL